MPLPAGQYSERFQHLVLNRTANGIGEEPACYTRGPFYWCSLSIENSYEVDDKGGNQTGQDGTLAVRNFPDVRARDMLEDSEGRMWRIRSIQTGDDELICDVFSHDVYADPEVDWVICEEEDSGSS
jgi:hypothetical protein